MLIKGVSKLEKHLDLVSIVKQTRAFNAFTRLLLSKSELKLSNRADLVKLESLRARTDQAQKIRA